LKLFLYLCNIFRRCDDFFTFNIHDSLHYDYDPLGGYIIFYIHTATLFATCKSTGLPHAILLFFVSLKNRSQR
ncbi:MAG TPA: hypothetical protein DD786_05930, partial [Porphyromonadaceae bacterium]|nr:hypothetical protein [Porphyromonadaceae bacterium]